VIDDLKYFYLSDFLHKKTFSHGGDFVGKIKDMVASVGDIYPLIDGIVISMKGTETYIPWKDIQEVSEKAIWLKEKAHSKKWCDQKFDKKKLLLSKDLLDKQIVDTYGCKVVRVNDLHLLFVENHMRLVHVDVGIRGLTRRLRWIRFIDFLTGWLFEYYLPDHLINWKYVQQIETLDLIKLNVPHTSLSQLHPADIADIIEELHVNQRLAFFKSLDKETAADVLEETDSKIQAEIIKTITPQEASDILEEMSPSEAVDILSELTREEAEDLLGVIEKDKADTMRILMRHPGKTAGGLMTTAYIAISAQNKVAQAILMLPYLASHTELLYYIYLVDEAGVIVGILTLRELFLADKELKLLDVAKHRVVRARLDMEEYDLIGIFLKYGFKAIPVVDEDDVLKGVINFRRIFELIAPKLRHFRGKK
ncbi:MAG: CBS domain-containing protein, partial [Thermodesulfobacteriota bacterium]|nr:CBS domain-containing protein [Thermodesulfobacteriota bacterium]